MSCHACGAPAGDARCSYCLTPARGLTQVQQQIGEFIFSSKVVHGFAIRRPNGKPEGLTFMGRPFTGEGHGDSVRSILRMHAEGVISGPEACRMLRDAMEMAQLVDVTTMGDTARRFDERGS